MDPRGLRPLELDAYELLSEVGQGACYGDGGSELRGDCFH